MVRLIDTGIEPTLECEIGVAFLDMPRAAQERIIRFALDVQLSAAVRAALEMPDTFHKQRRVDLLAFVQRQFISDEFVHFLT